MWKLGDFEDIEIYITLSDGIIIRSAGNDYINSDTLQLQLLNAGEDYILEVQLLNIRDSGYIVLLDLSPPYCWEFPLWCTIDKIIDLESFRNLPDLLVFDILEG